MRSFTAKPVIKLKFNNQHILFRNLYNSFILKCKSRSYKSALLFISFKNRSFKLIKDNPMIFFWSFC